MMKVKGLIKKYHLLPHPEGGWYKETYKSNEVIAASALPRRFNAARTFSTAIYFLLEQGNFSAFHRIKSDECWHFYAGGPLDIFELHTGGRLVVTRLGSNIENGELFQYIVPANCWFASRPSGESNYCFVGCTVAPGFDFADFEMAKAADLKVVYPQHKIIIDSLCR
jgi:uncharacterized protein